MAPRTKDEVELVRVTYPRDGLLGAEIGGQSFEVPASIRNKAGWIESRYREEQSRKAAEVEKEQRDARVLRDRQEQIRQEAADKQRRNDLSAELALLRQEIADVRQEVASPDELRLLEVNQNTTTCMGRVLDAADKVAGLVDRVEELEARAQELAVLADADRQVSLDLIKSQTELINGIQKSNAELINDYATRYTEAAQQAIDLSSQINANWETVQNAARINETAIAQATAASKKLLQEQHQEFLAAMSVAFSAMGVTQEMVENELVRMEQGLLDRNTVILGPDYLAQMISVTKKYRDARADAEQRTNLASAQSAGRLSAFSGEVAT